MSLALGSRLGPYEVLSPLGAGGMGGVFRARDTRLEKQPKRRFHAAHDLGLALEADLGQFETAWRAAIDWFKAHL
jgi:hypothetical protein